MATTKTTTSLELGYLRYIHREAAHIDIHYLEEFLVGLHSVEKLKNQYNLGLKQSVMILISQHNIQLLGAFAPRGT